MPIRRDPEAMREFNGRAKDHRTIQRRIGHVRDSAPRERCPGAAPRDRVRHAVPATRAGDHVRFTSPGSHDGIPRIRSQLAGSAHRADRACASPSWGARPGLLHHGASFSQRPCDRRILCCRSGTFDLGRRASPAARMRGRHAAARVAMREQPPARLRITSCDSALRCAEGCRPDRPDLLE